MESNNFAIRPRALQPREKYSLGYPDPEAMEQFSRFSWPTKDHMYGSSRDHISRSISLKTVLSPSYMEPSSHYNLDQPADTVLPGYILTFPSHHNFNESGRMMLHAPYIGPPVYWETFQPVDPVHSSTVLGFPDYSTQKPARIISPPPGFEHLGHRILEPSGVSWPVYIPEPQRFILLPVPQFEYQYQYQHQHGYPQPALPITPPPGFGFPEERMPREQARRTVKPRRHPPRRRKVNRVSPDAQSYENKKNNKNKKEKNRNNAESSDNGHIHHPRPLRPISSEEQLLNGLRHYPALTPPPSPPSGENPLTRI